MIKIHHFKGFSLIELSIIITIISAIVITTAPSIYGVFKRQLLKLNTNQISQDIRNIQSNAFLEHKYHKIEFDNDNNTYSTWVNIRGSWQLIALKNLTNQTIRYDLELDNTLGLIYGPNGNAYICNKNNSIEICKQNQLEKTAQISIISDSKETTIQFLPFNGFVSSNYSIK